MAEVLTDVYGKPGGFWGDHTTLVGPTRPPGWLGKLVGWGLAHDLTGALVALRLFARRRHARGIVTDGGASGILFATLQTIVPWGRRPHVMIDCNWYESPAWWRTWLKGLRLRLAARSVRRFVVWASHELEDYVRVFGLPEEKLEYVPFHITLTGYEYEERDDGYLFAGGNYDRDYPTLIEAVRDLDIPTWIATTRPEQLNGVVVPPHVRVEGTSMAGFRQAIAAARLVVVPMQPGLLHSGGQQTCLNAMYMGKPTIAVGRRWAVDLIRDGEDGLIVDYADPIGLRRAIRWVLENPEAARALGERARKKASWFTTERTMRTIHALATVEEPAQALAPSWEDSSLQPTPRTGDQTSSSLSSLQGRSRQKEVLLAARWPVGGIRTHLRYNHPALVEAGHRFTLVVPDDESLPALRQTLPDATIVPVPVIGRDCPLWRSLRPLVASGRFGLVHAHGLTAAAHASLACLGQDVPLIVTVHEPLRDEQFSGLIGHGKRWLLGRALARAEAVVTVSNDARSNLLRHFPNLRRHQERIRTIANGIDVTVPEVEECSSPLREELGLDDETFLLGFLGRFMPEKGFAVLLEAVARLVRFGSVPGFHLVAFGSGDYRQAYARRIEELGLGKHVSLRDFVPDVRAVLDQLDLVVVPSLWEASSLVSMEAMCAGVPVLGSDCPGLREVLHDTPSRTVATGVVSALETGLREALAHPWFTEAARFVPGARERFDNRRSATLLVELYRSVLAPSAQPGVPLQQRARMETVSQSPLAIVESAGNC